MEVNAGVVPEVLICPASSQRTVLEPPVTVGPVIACIAAPAPLLFTNTASAPFETELFTKLPTTPPVVAAFFIAEIVLPVPLFDTSKAE